MNYKAPKFIIDPQAQLKLTLTNVVKSNGKTFLTYQVDSRIFVLSPREVELNFYREKPPTITPVITQGKYECAASALAMLLDEKLFTVKRAMAKFHWRNDDSGANDEVLLGAARELGYDLIDFNPKKLHYLSGPCLLTVPSLNVKKMNHAVTWTGSELLDPNTHYPNRNFWGADWSPDLIEAVGCLKLLPQTLSSSERQEYDHFRKTQETTKINSIREQVLAAINK